MHFWETRAVEIAYRSTGAVLHIQEFGTKCLWSKKIRITRILHISCKRRVPKQYKFAVLNFVSNKTILSILFCLVDVTFVASFAVKSSNSGHVQAFKKTMCAQMCGNCPVLVRSQRRMADHQCTAFPPAFVLIWISSKLAIPLDTCCGMSHHVMTPRCDRLRRMFIGVYVSRSSLLWC